VCEQVWTPTVVGALRPRRKSQPPISPKRFRGPVDPHDAVHNYHLTMANVKRGPISGIFLFSTVREGRQRAFLLYIFEGRPDAVDGLHDL